MGLSEGLGFWGLEVGRLRVGFIDFLYYEVNRLTLNP